MLYQLNYIHHLWDCKDSVFPINNPNFSFQQAFYALISGEVDGG